MAANRLALSLRVLNPLDAGRQIDPVIRGSRDHLYRGVTIAGGRSIQEPYREVLNDQRRGNAGTDLVDQLPENSLLLDIEVVESADMPARDDDHVAGGQRMGMRDCQGQLGGNPGFLGRDFTICTFAHGTLLYIADPAYWKRREFEQDPQA